MVKITDATYSYSQGGIVTVSAMAQVLAEDGLTILYQAGLSANAHLQSKTWRDELKLSLIKQAQQLASDYTKALLEVAIVFPTAKSPAEALALFVGEVNTALGVA